ncbi:hypothetical protein DH2020_030774 [Rehmannia glutinosa]|uniref:DUF4283 domain-containing protein n=1 Tax=Rehmannia glutinosa TaxID=99300 RepID=A0ABR0VJX7_REHGL
MMMLINALATANVTRSTLPNLQILTDNLMFHAIKVGLPTFAGLVEVNLPIIIVENPSGTRSGRFCQFCEYPGHEVRTCRKLAKLLKANNLQLRWSNGSNPSETCVRAHRLFATIGNLVQWYTTLDSAIPKPNRFILKSGCLESTTLPFHLLQSLGSSRENSLSVSVRLCRVNRQSWLSSMIACGSTGVKSFPVCICATLLSVEGYFYRMEEDLNSLYARLSLGDKERSPISTDDLSSHQIDPSLSLVGKLLAPRIISFDQISSLFRKLWNPKGSLSCKPLHDNVVLFIFGSLADKMRVMAGTPWIFDRYILLLREATEDMISTQLQFTTCPFWVQLHGLPLGLFSKTFAERAGNYIGKFLEFCDCSYYYADHEDMIPKVPYIHTPNMQQTSNMQKTPNVQQTSNMQQTSNVQQIPNVQQSLNDQQSFNSADNFETADADSILADNIDNTSDVPVVRKSSRSRALPHYLQIYDCGIPPSLQPNQSTQNAMVDKKYCISNFCLLINCLSLINDSQLQSLGSYVS